MVDLPTSCPDCGGDVMPEWDGDVLRCGTCTWRVVVLHSGERFIPLRKIEITMPDDIDGQQIGEMIVDQLVKFQRRK